ncbi:MAG: ZIP family metal transporter [Candidatus Korarchaeum sp.]|nr:ZIP family metal transporter [Candidatus Korarchaeum sp.]MDW8036271.1 ZIP family metal transporter [Candidatus Korarchaeum sp.]
MTSEGALLRDLIQLIEEITAGDPMIASFIAGTFIMLTTSLGAASILILGEGVKSALNFSMSFAAGIMLVASFTSLILPAMEMTDFFPTIISGFLIGFFALIMIERFLPHEHPVLGYEGPEAARRAMKKAWLLAIAVIIHNFPEGLAVGVSIAYSIPLGMATAIAIGVQDIPEGLAIALPLSSLLGRREGLLIGVLSGLSELLMALISTMALKEFNLVLPFGMSFAGGAMLYVTLKEVIPEVYGENYSTFRASVGFLIGFLVMLYLDSAL